MKPSEDLFRCKFYSHARGILRVRCGAKITTANEASIEAIYYFNILRNLSDLCAYNICIVDIRYPKVKSLLQSKGMFWLAHI